MTTLPAPINPRRNGWTADRQCRFIAALGETASVVQAAARVGMSPRSAYWLRQQPAAADFRAAWDAAIDQAWRRVEATALERVLHGETEIIERDGIRVTRHRPCAPHLVIHMVERAIKAREKAAEAGDGDTADGDALRRIDALAAGFVDRPGLAIDEDEPPETAPSALENLGIREIWEILKAV
jgi:hypothetical protein